MTTVELNQQLRRPSTPPAALLPVTHEPIVGRFAASAPLAVAGYGISVSADRTTAGAGIPKVNLQFMGDARGVPPRGRSG